MDTYSIEMFNCVCCNFVSNNKSTLKRHTDTQKHEKCLLSYNIKQEKEAKEAKKDAELLLKRKEKQEKEAKKDAKEVELLLLKKQEKQEKEVKEVELLLLKKQEKEAKEKEKENKNNAIDWRDLYYKNIKDIINFNWKLEINGNHFFSNLLIAIVTNEKLNCVRFKNNKYEMWEETDNGYIWNNKSFDEEYDFNDIAHRLKDIMYDCPLISSYNHKMNFIAYDLDKDHVNTILKGIINKILNGDGQKVLINRHKEYEKYNEKVLKEREPIEESA